MMIKKDVLAERRARLTPAQQALLQSRLQPPGGVPSEGDVIARQAHDERVLASFAQQRQWFLWQLAPESPGYHLVGGLHFDGVLDEAALRASLQALVERHAALRTVFGADADGAVWQIVQRAQAVEMPVSTLSGAQVDEETRRLCDRPFDLQRGPLMRVSLLRLAPQAHRLVVVMHHIVSDGWSTQLILHELAQLYRARLEGVEARLPRPDIDYRDYAAWQRDWLQQGEAQRQLDYWTRQLGGEAVQATLSPDHARPARPTGAAAEHATHLPASLTDALRSLAGAHGGTLFTALLAGWQALLFRHTGQSDLRVGVPIANRNRAETARVVGFFVNTQVHRANVQPRMTLTELLLQVRDTAFAAQSHQDLPFERLVEALQPDRSLGRHPLFQVMFNHLRRDDAALAGWPRLAVRRLDFVESAAQFDVTLQTVEHDDGTVSAVLRYAQDLFEPATIARLAAHYVAVLQALVEQPQRAVGDVALMEDGERARLLRWGEHQTGAGGLAPLHRRFEDQARRRPEAIALTCGTVSLRYAELNRRANRLAHRLIALGVAPEVKVGLAAERSIELVVGVLAILKAGGAYVPLDPEYPADRLGYMAADSGVRLVLVRSSSGPLPAGLSVLDMAIEDEVEGNLPEHDPAVQVHQAHLAYVIYTSGSTGRPKGVQVSHGNVARLLEATRPWFGFGDEDVWTLFHSYAFDFSVWELFGALCTGGRLVVVPGLVARSPEDFVALLLQQRVTVLNQTPSAFGQLMQVPGLYEGARLALRLVIFGGEALEPRRLGPWMAQWGDAAPRFVNMYGITETTVHVTYRPIGRADLQAGGSPVGGAMPDLGLRVLDDGLAPVPIGVPGELYVAGEGLARGYLGRPGLTATRFVADPFDARGQRLYRTGDQVKWTETGTLEYLGRIDQQVKLRGFRIELGEIEAQLLAQPEVKEAVALVRPGPAGPRLVAYLSLRQPIDSARLRARLGGALPDYMVPSALVVLDGLPLTSNGKVDRRALPEPDPVAGGFEPPLGEVETALAAVWAEVLGVPRVGRHDNFFELGGHSLLALRLLERVRTAGWPAPVRLLFQWPRLIDFARAVSQPGNIAAEAVVPPNLIPAGCTAIQPEMLTLVDLDAAAIAGLEAAVPGGASNIQDIYPLAPLQEGILFHHLLQSEGDAYITRSLLSFESEAELKRFVSCLQRVVDRHDILRTTVWWEGLGEPVQVVLRQAAVEIQWLDIDAGADAAAQLRAHVDPAHYRIDVRTAPMLRAIAARDAAQKRWLLQLPCHHLILDHTTLQRLIDEIAVIAKGNENGLAAPRPFRDFVAQARLGVSREEQEAFFSALLGDVDKPTAPFGLLDVHGDGLVVEEAHSALPAPLAERLRAAARRHGVGVASLFHLAWGLVMATATGEDDVVFGTVLFGRMQGGEGVARALGLFINTLPLRVRTGSRSVANAVRETHAALTGLMRHEHASLSLAQRCSALPAGTPLFSAVLNYRHGLGRAGSGHVGLGDGVNVLASEERSNYPLLMAIDDLGDDFELTAQAATPVSATWLLNALTLALASLADALAADAQQPVSELAVLDPAELNRLRQWGENPRHFHDPAPAHRHFERQAALRPDATAVVFRGERSAYAELNRRANRLARRLRLLGVESEGRVGIAVPRGPFMLEAVLAVLKAGGAYVPLDPEYPSERLAYMAADSGIRWLLTENEAPAWANGLGIVAVPVGSVERGSLPDADLDLPVHPEHLAYVIYTSGSTGRPKGVMVRHGALSHFLLSMQQHPGMVREDVLLAVTSLSFDIAALELLLPLASGACVVVAPGETVRDGEALAALVESSGATQLQSTPAGWRLLRAGGWPRGARSTLKGLCGGEALQPDLALELNGLGVALWNLYGPTETTIWSSAAPVLEGRHPGIGAAIAGTRLHVLDAALNPVPAGVPGELYLGGVGLARGYLQRAGLTSERFVANPWGDPGSRLYRTGDLVRWTRQGRLDYLGRLDHQVKIRGYRIELGEIEAQLLASPEVREAVVTASVNAKGTFLAGYVSLKAGEAIEGAALRERLAGTLPEHMVPAAVVVLDALPLNGSGKVDRKALPDVAAVGGREFEAPQGPKETALAAVWASVLGRTRIGRHDDFFELGGDSILNLQIVAKARGEGLRITPRQLFEHRSVARLADVAEVVAPVIEAASAPPAWQVLLTDEQRLALPFAPEQIEDVFPLTPMQQGMLLHTLLDPKSGMYLMQHRFSIGSQVDVEAFWLSWDAVVDEHAALRAGFFWRMGEAPYQVIRRDVAVPKAYLDLRHLPRAAALARIDRLLSDELVSGFDLTRAPLLRVRLVQLRDDELQLVVSFHHVIMDAWCFGLLMSEVLATYDARVTGVERVREQAAPYRDFIAWLQGQDREAAREYWRGVLAGFDVVTPLPLRRHVAAGSSGSRMVDVGQRLTAEQTLRLHTLARRHQVTPNTLIQGAWAWVLGCHAGLRDILFGVTVSGRPAQKPALQRTLGLFINTIPLRVALPAPGETVSVVAWLRKLLNSNIDSREFDYLPLLDIQAASALPADRPLFDSLFVYENAAVDASLLQRAEASDAGHSGSRTHTNYPLTVMIVPEEQMLLQLTYDERSFEAGTVERLLDSFRHVVEQFIDRIEAPLSSVGCLPAPARLAILQQGTGRGTAQPFEAGYIGLFQRQVLRNPQAIAARCGSDSIRYGELDINSGRLATSLRHAGVVPGDVVVLLGERCLGWLESVLACFKLGAAYLAVDPALPAQRLSTLLVASKAKLVLVDEAATQALSTLDGALSLLPDPRLAPRVVRAQDARLEAEVAPPVAVHPDQPAYVIFTSGSTGEPKGVVVTSRGMLNNQLSKVDGFPMTAGDVVAQTASQSFDISVWQLLGGLLCGAVVEIVPTDIARDPIALQKWVRDSGVTILECVPSLVQGMLASAPMPLPSLRMTLMTGEGVKLPLVRGWQARHPHVAVVNAYGPAECADDVALHVDPPAAGARTVDEEGLFPIGLPVDNLQLCVLDERLEPAPIGVPGELYVSGIGVGQGYLSRPGLTAERFVADLLSGHAGARMYRTGDIARWRPDGVFEYLGRSDGQVKLRGYRIELGEIDAVLARHPGVRDAVTTVWTDAAGAQRLVAYVVLRAPDQAQGDASPAHDDEALRRLRSHLAERLPDYMVPSLWVPLAALPLNANGKTDRAALPAPVVSRQRDTRRPPVTATQVALADIWRHVLRAEHVGLDDNFFELGGHSLAAMQVVARVQTALKKDVAINALFMSPTLERFAASVDQAAGQAGDAALGRLENFFDTVEGP